LIEVQATTINGDPADGTALIPTSPTTSLLLPAIAVVQSSASLPPLAGRLVALGEAPSFNPSMEARILA